LKGDKEKYKGKTLMKKRLWKFKFVLADGGRAAVQRAAETRHLALSAAERWLRFEFGAACDPHLTHEYSVPVLAARQPAQRAALGALCCHSWLPVVVLAGLSPAASLSILGGVCLLCIAAAAIVTGKIEKAEGGNAEGGNDAVEAPDAMERFSELLKNGGRR